MIPHNGRNQSDISELRPPNEAVQLSDAVFRPVSAFENLCSKIVSGEVHCVNLPKSGIKKLHDLCVRTAHTPLHQQPIASPVPDPSN